MLNIKVMYEVWGYEQPSETTMYSSPNMVKQEEKEGILVQFLSSKYHTHAVIKTPEGRFIVVDINHIREL